MERKSWIRNVISISLCSYQYLFDTLSFVKQSVLVTDFGHVKVVCQKDNGEFLHKSFFDTTFFHGSMKAINLIYSVHIKAVNLIYLYTGASHVYYLSVPNSLFCSYAQFFILYRLKHINSLHVLKQIFFSVHKAIW